MLQPVAPLRREVGRRVAAHAGVREVEGEGVDGESAGVPVRGKGVVLD